MTRILAFLLALAPALAGAVQLTLDLTGPGLYPAGTEFQSVRLYSVRAGSDATMELRGFRPLTLTRSFLDSASVAVDVPASPDGQAYRLWVNGESIDFVMPSDPASLSAILQAQAARGATGPCVVDSAPTGPPNPSPGDLWCKPPESGPPAVAAVFSFRADGQWHQVEGGGGGGGSVKAFARLGGRQIALSDTQFADTVEDSIDGDRFSYNAQTGTVTCQTHGRSDCGFTIPPSQGRTETELRTEILDAVQADAPLERRESGSGATRKVHIGASNLGDRVSSAERSVAALRRTRSIGSHSWTQAVSDGGALASGVSLPTTPHAQLLEVHRTGEAAVQCTIVLGELREKGAVTSPRTLDDTNSLTCAYGGVTYRYAHDNGSGLYVSADSIGSYAQDYSIDELDLNNLARKSSTSPWPASQPAGGGAWAPGRDTKTWDHRGLRELDAYELDRDGDDPPGGHRNARGADDGGGQDEARPLPAGVPGRADPEGGGDGAAVHLPG